MECDICHRGHDAKRLPFLCTVDSRNQIYESRIKHLQLIIENENLQDQAGLPNAITTPNRDLQNSLQAQQRSAEDRTTHILAAADKLRNDIKAAKEEIQARKAALSRRKSDLSSIAEGLAERKTRQQNDVEKSIGMLKYRMGRCSEDMAKTRSFLCKEAARLYGLKRTKKGSSQRYEYQLGKVAVVDLTAMNCKSHSRSIFMSSCSCRTALSPESISTSLAHVAHVLMITSHYLGVRLPAAITVPHRDYPRPTIFNLTGSYLNAGAGIFPGTGYVTPTAEARESDSQHISRPRPLFIDKPLSQISKEDPAAYSYFLEGVTLLAYNIAWLCSTQGIPIGDRSSFEDICSMGRNLYSLLISQQTESGNVFPGDSVNKSSATNLDDGDAQNNWMGRYSHVTTCYFLTGANGTDFTKNFKLPNPMKLADKLKKKLVSETPTPDWEMLDDDAWKIEEGTAETLLIETQNRLDQDEPAESKSSPRRGSSGWMKVKNR